MYIVYRFLRSFLREVNGCPDRSPFAPRTGLGRNGRFVRGAPLLGPRRLGRILFVRVRVSGLTLNLITLYPLTPNP